MFDFLSRCTRCTLEISPQRQSQQPPVCNHCGHIRSNANALITSEIERSSIMHMLIITALILTSYIQVMNWDRYALDIIPITLKEWAGQTSSSDWTFKAQMCLDLKKWDCVERQYAKLAQQDPQFYAQLGEFQMKRQRSQLAAQSFKSYFNQGGQDGDMAYLYAKALTELNQIDEAIKFYELAIASKPETLQVTVGQSYVKLLMSHNRHAEASQAIKKLRKQSSPDSQFMEAEYRQINHQISANRD